MERTTTTLKARIPNAVMLVPEAVSALQAFSRTAENGSAPSTTIQLVQLRASQINGCSVCVDMHSKLMRASGQSEERLYAVSAWRDSPLFTDAERAALALSEAVTRIADKGDAVSDAVWDEAARHFDEPGLVSLLIGITAINVWNRLNVSLRNPAGQWTPSGGWEKAASELASAG